MPIVAGRGPRGITRPLSVSVQACQREYDQRMLSEIILQAEAIAAQDRWLGRSQARLIPSPVMPVIFTSNVHLHNHTDGLRNAASMHMFCY